MSLVTASIVKSSDFLGRIYFISLKKTSWFQHETLSIRNWDPSEKIENLARFCNLGGLFLR